MFEGAQEFCSLAGDLLERPAEGFRVAHELSRELARYAQPFDRTRFAAGLRALAV
jgi:hypothetical protein